jgi:hypothetical protein
MLGNERLGVHSRPFQGGQVALIADVPERDTNISQEPAPLDSLDRRTEKEPAKSCLIQGKIIAQPHVHRWAGSERRFAGDRRKPIPRACIEAVIASVNPVADERPQFERDRTF